jgi:hypothetical protein
MIVLNESAAEDFDGVAAAAAALVEAAKASSVAYTPQDLQEALSEQIEVLKEGVVSWIRKKVTGIDPELFARIEAKFAGGLTPAEKESSTLALSKAIVRATARIEKVDEWMRASKDPSEEMTAADMADMRAWKAEARDHIAKAKALKARLAKAP